MVQKQETKVDYLQMETEAIKKAQKIIDAVEKFLAKWDSLKKKPDSLNSKILKLKKFHASLVLWQKDAVKSQTKKGTKDEDRIKRLRSFVEIYRSYS